MGKKLLLILITIILISVQKAYTKELLKINSINIDNSGNIVFITGKSTEPRINGKIQTSVLENPKRVYFDVDDAVLTIPNKSIFVQNSTIMQVRLSQFSINPHVVRVTIHLSEGEKPENITAFTINNNIAVKYGNEIGKSTYYNQIYSENQVSSGFYEKVRYAEEEKQNVQEEPSPQALNKNQIPKASDDDMFEQIQKALGETIAPSEPPKRTQPAPQKPQMTTPQKTFASDSEQRLWSKYFINRIDTKQGNILINGTGILNLKAPIYLSNPSRVVFDFDNTVVSQKYKNKELQISDTETLKLGQFEPSRARLVITTNQPQKYRAIYSFDLQSILIANDARLLGLKLFDKSADLLSYRLENQQEKTDLLYLNFSAPIIHSITRNSEKLELNLHNIAGLQIEELKKSLKGSNFEHIKIEKLPYVGSKFSIPIEKGSYNEYWQSADAKKLILKLKNPEKQTRTVPTVAMTSQAIVVLDPGHGGSDTGALRESILEKDINLEVAKRVAQILTKNGVQVEMTRWADQTVSLSDRVAFSESKTPICFVSIHVNSSVRNDITGLETHYYHEESYPLATTIHKSLASKVSSNDRGLFKSKFYVINHTTAPAVLVEIGFISNDGERKQLITDLRKQKTAEAVAEGIMQYINSKTTRGNI